MIEIWYDFVCRTFHIFWWKNISGNLKCTKCGRGYPHYKMFNMGDRDD